MIPNIIVNAIQRFIRIPKDSHMIKELFIVVGLGLKQLQAKANISDKKYAKIKNGYEKKMQQLYLLYRKAKF